MTQIPKISNETLEQLMKRIKPVVRMAKVTTSRGSSLERHSEGDLYFIKEVDPRKMAFTWDPKPARVASKVNPNPYKTITTVHDYGAPVLFKPSIAEVLAQIEEEDCRRCVAFETNTTGGFTAGGEQHLAETRLYEKKR